MPKQIITSSSAPTTGFTPGQSVSPLAQAIRFGNMLFVSGQGALDPATGTVVQGDITVQTRQTLDNLMKTPVFPKIISARNEDAIQIDPAS